MRISRVIGHVAASKKNASVSQRGMAGAEKRVRRRCCRSERIAHRVPDVGLQRFCVIRDKEDAAIRQQSCMNSSRGPVGHRRPLALGGSLGVTAYSYCYNEQK